MASTVRGLLVAVAFLSTTSLSAAQTQGAADATAAVYVRAHRQISTTIQAAQAAFDDGLTLLYAFNPQEARRSFQRAAAADPGLAMSYWGIAMSYGININTPYDAGSQRQGRDAVMKAKEREASASAVERALIGAAAERFSYVGKSDADASARSYAAAMAGVAAAYPEDDDVVTLAAEAAMDTHPWGYWNADGKPQSGTPQIVHELQTVLARNPSHIGANHYLIHAVEASPHPEDALDSARRLAADVFEPAAEHLAHMPAHTFMRVGEYDAAGEANLRALDDFRRYLDGPHAPGHEGYYGHDCLFGVDAFMMAGDHGGADGIAARCQDAARRYEGLVAVRFGRWADLAPFAAETPFLNAIWDAAEGRLSEALAVAKQLEAAKSDTATIGADIVRARVYARRGQTDLEIAALERAVREQDSLGYSEPPGWFYPVRESLGGAEYRAARYGAAERTFRDDLARNPGNPRSLFGLAQTLAREGRPSDAAAAHQRFLAAWRHADVELDMAHL